MMLNLEDEVNFIMELDKLKKELEEKEEKIKQLLEDNSKLRESLDGKEDLQMGVQDEFIEKSKMHDGALKTIESMENEKKQVQVDYQRLEKKVQSEREQMEKDKKILEARYQKQGEMLKEKDQIMLNLKSKVETLEENIKQNLEPIKKELIDTKERLNVVEKELQTKSATLKETDDKLRDITFQLASKKENHEREVISLKAMHAKELEKIRSQFSSDMSDMKKQGEMPSFYLKYQEKAFTRSISLPKGIFLLLDDSNETWILDISNEINMIERKTAERLARQIANSGYIEGGKRLGVKYKLEIQEKK